MELPFGGAGAEFPVNADQIGQSTEDELMNTPQHHFALSIPMTPGNLALDLSGCLGSLSGFESSTIADFGGTNQRGQTPEMSFGGADSFEQLSQDFQPGTWFPVDQQVPVPAYFNQQPIPGSSGSFGNATSVATISDWDNTNLLYSSMDQDPICYWPYFPEPQNSNIVPLELATSHFNGSGFVSNNTDIAHTNPSTSFQNSVCRDARTSEPVTRPEFSNSVGRGTRPSKKKQTNTRLKKRPYTLGRRALPCATCWGQDKKCEGKPDCKRCVSKLWPCIRERITMLKTFQKWLLPEYESKIVFPPLGSVANSKVVRLRHDPKGPPLLVRCYEFKPDHKQPHQTQSFWQGTDGYHQIDTTVWSLVDLNHDLEPYIEEAVPVFVGKACHGPEETAVLFRLAQELADKPIIHLGFKMYTGYSTLLRGWSIGGENDLGMPILYADGAPLDGEIPVPAVMERQLDHILEKLLAKWELEFCELWQNMAKEKGNRSWAELFLSSFLIIHVMELDAQRLKIRFVDEEALNGWKHPQTPTTLVQKAIHFCNVFLAHFRAIQGCDPLRLDTLKEDWAKLARGDKTTLKVMEALRIHKSYLHAHSLIDQKPWRTYKRGDHHSFDFTWSGRVFGMEDLIKMEDFLGPGVPGWT